MRTAALERTAIIRLAGQNPFGVDNAYRSEVELRASFNVVGGSEDVETAEVDLLRDGTRVEGVPVTREGGGWACTIPRGKTFNPDSDWHLAFVANRNTPSEMRAAPKRLRPAWLEFGGTAEAQNETQLDLIKLFNPTPRLSLRAVSEPVGGRRVSMRVSGDVVSSLGPISRVAIDGRTVPVTQTDSGLDGTGPFEGTFTADVSLGPQTTLILAHAMNGLGNLASDALVVTPVTDAQGQIVERTIQEESPLSPLDQDPSEYAFRVDLKDRGQVGATVKIGIDSGVETKVVVLRRQGNAFRSDPLYLVPENFVAPPGMPEELQGRVVKGRLGLQPKVIYAQNIKEEAALTGALLVDAASGAPIDAVKPSDSSAVRQTLRLVVGASGDAGDELTSTLQSLGGDLREAAQVLGAPVNQPVRLVRQSADPEAAGYNLFVSTTPILPVYTREAVERSGTAAHGVVGTGFLRLSVADVSTIEPVGVPAETAQWVVEDVRPVFAEAAGMRAASGEGGDERQLRFFDVVVSAVVHGAAATVPALALAMAFDAAADLAGEISDIRQVVPVGETYEEVPFPAETTVEGKTYVRIRMQVARYQDLGPGQRLKGVTLRALDFGGGSVRDLLAVLGSGMPAPLAIQSALVASGLAPLTTRFVAGMTAAGVPQSVEAVVGQIIREVYTPVAKMHFVYPLVVQALRAGYALDGQTVTEAQLEELAVALMVGGGLGVPLGVLQAVYDDLNLFAQLRDLTQLLYYAALADQALSQVKWLLIAGAVQFVISDEFRQQVTERFTRMAPVLLEAARVAVMPEVLHYFGAMVARSFYQGYETALHPYIPWLGLQHGTRAETSFLIGFMMGHIGGYVAEIAATLFASGLITAGIGAAIVAVTKVNKVGKVAKAVSVVRRLSVLPYREANAVEKVAKILLDWLKMAGNIDERKLAGFLDDAVLVGREGDLLQLVERYGLDVEVLDTGAGVRLTRVEALARALSGTEETAQVALRLAEITRRRVRVGNELRPLVFTEEGLEKAAKGLDNLILAVKAGHV
ncbi:MAG: hypothetical protein JW775_10970, partial [Candidatus Aminicenantes bacterium]|nr:hypothetical protein [Candidatus Aminicenantes bacterium]